MLPDAPTATHDVQAGPRAALLWAMLSYALASLLLGFPALAGEFLVNPNSDQYIAGYAFRHFAAEWMRETGSFPLWNPYLFGGMPYVAAMHGDIFYPTFLLRLVLPTDVAMTWGFIVHEFLAGLFTYLFLRRIGVGFAGALVGGLAYMLSGQIASYASPGHDGKLFVSTLLPLFLLALHAGVRDGRRWAWGAVAIVVGLAVLSPHPQLLQYMLLCGGFYALYLTFSAPPTGEALPRAIGLRRLGYSLAAIVLGGAIGAIQFVPVAEYVAWSPRAGGTGWEHAVSYSMPIEELLVNTWLPQFTGILESYWGRNGIHFHSEYLGVAVLFLAGLGLLRGAAPTRSMQWFWIGVLVVTALWALGGFTPFYSLVYAVVPGTKYFRAPSTIYYVTSFAIAVLAAFGTRRVVRGEVTIRYTLGWLGFAVLIVVIAMAGGFTSLGLAVALPGREDAVFANASNVVAGAWRSAAFIAGIVALAILISRDRLRGHLAVGALALLVVADLWSIERRYWRFSPPAEVLFAADGITEYLQSQPEPGRVLPLGLVPTRGRGPYLGYGSSFDGLMAHGIRQFIGYHGNELGRFQSLLDGGPAGSGLANPNLWALYNVRYFLTNVAESPFVGAEHLVGPVMDAAGTELHLFSVPGDNPAAWVAPAIVKAADDAVLATVLDPRFNVHSVALMTDSATVETAQLTTAPAPLDLPVEVVRYDPGHIALRLSGPAPDGSALVVSENYYPGWRATVDGSPAELWRTNYALIGVPLPAGAREVTLRFESAPYETGKLITLLALALSTALLVGGVALDRRSVARG